MSETLYIGLSREQVGKLVQGNAVGKRPYRGVTFNKRNKHRYNGNVRVEIFMLDDKETKREPKEAFF